MDRMLLKIFGLLLILAAEALVNSAWAAGNRPEERMAATVVEFTVRGDLDEQAGAILADLMMSAIANSNRFTLKDRLPLSAAAKIAKSQELGSTGLIDPKTAAELGRVYGVDAVVTGGVSKLGDLITVTARLIDTKTASLLGSGQIQEKNIDAIQIKVAELATMIMTPPEMPKTYALTVVTEPAGAAVRLLNYPSAYQAGIQLSPGDYEVEVAHSGYKTRKESVRISDRDLTTTIALELIKYSLTINPEPTDAQIRMSGGAIAYQPGVALPPGKYEVEVSKEGYTPRKLPVQIVDGAVTLPVVLDKTPPSPEALYRLTVQTDPSRATVRLLNVKTPYRAGVRLPPGDYSLEITLSGYESTRVSARIVDSDVVVPVTLTKRAPEPVPQQYRLTVRADPSNAQIRLRGVKAAYKPGISLPPGAYTVEVSRTGYETQRISVRITDSDVTVPVTLDKLPEPKLYQITVQVDPPDARVRLRGVKTAYRPGVRLPPGSYTVEASRSGYESKSVTVRITDSDVALPIALNKLPEVERYRLTVQASPSSARVRLVSSAFAYRPGVQLPSGSYTVEVTGQGYQSRRLSVQIADRDVTLPVELEKIAVPPPQGPSIPPPSSGEQRIGSVQVDSSVSGQDRAEVQRILGGYVGRTATRDTLLSSAMQVYRSTGITLSFSVRSGSSGNATVYARVARRVRRTYESNIPIMTPSQLENSGFGVSSD